MGMESTSVKYGRYLMHCLKNDSFFDLNNAYANLGDSIQALAMDSIYEQIGVKKEDIRYIKRDFASEYDGEPVRVPFYSEFAKANIRNRLAMSDSVLVKILLGAVFYDDFEALETVCPACREMVKAWEPVSARDEKTADYLRAQGIEAYLTGCFTICFPKRETTPRKKKVFFVDTPKNLEPYIPSELKENCEYITQGIPIMEYPIGIRENERLENISSNLLKKYRDEATLVVTSRLHAAIPCIAFGIPVIFASTNVDFRFSWIEKLIHPYQYEEYGQINWQPEPVDVESVKQKMLSLIKNALTDRPYLDEMKWLDSFFRDRERVEPYMHYKTIVDTIGTEHREKPGFTYIIWGAGYHCGYALQLIGERLPEAKPVMIVDKYKKGIIEGIEITPSDNVPEVHADHLVITTVHGMKDALEWREKRAPQIPYTLLISDQKS